MGRIDYESETFIVCATGDVTHTLKADGFDGSEDGTGRGTPIVSVLPFDTTQITSRANRSNPQPGDSCYPLAAGAHAPCIAFNANAQACQLPTERSDTGVSSSLTCSQSSAIAYSGSPDHNSPPPALLTPLQVRRLTPLECERLQGFPDHHTAIARAKDGPRYKALGNSMAVPVIRWIGQQIDFAHHWFNA